MGDWSKVKKMAALGNLVAGVANEVNTPLGISENSVSHMLKKQGIELVMDTESNIELVTQPGVIVQDMSNLVANAIRHAFPENKLNIDKQLVLKCRREGDFAILEYCDNGVGVKKEHTKQRLACASISCSTIGYECSLF